MKGRRASYIAGSHNVPDPVADNLAQGSFEPRLIRLIDEAKDLIAVEVGNQERKSVGDRAQPALAFLYGFLGALLVGDVQMRADEP